MVIHLWSTVKKHRILAICLLSQSAGLGVAYAVSAHQDFFAPRKSLVVGVLVAWLVLHMLAVSWAAAATNPEIGESDGYDIPPPC
ncbi:MAG: hypothetical protein A3J07_04805 [Candidatus Doudnabacteria bacterium RIFCSPLOWO2_02_FULL_49_13]|uniref:Uncharacterized protein n=1 Tax=Candidatus Doudnabacteria bacterium RIFCSPHIGHO2_12_FULL_48_16 TaxID=1817838 RepID=A0A1F5PK94_9BACT|nr:MAG: hypothetical protein A3B77_01605 [Candidatus Doudnabacteria bacterium RIFCSPHIGHO2_02_FULL_49_24]OGE89854.1 MAG: hypothetical protein A2760_03675 [Candidatus Doudnabacteria bacterium RIFCSPHIGHO2_01_FULL_50_67]OGE90224.1 MAG: hypothetical protein A3E29_03945 [Candidatus Doudnabacteria bacterium RIFCSPHIGHO2_12_FULL_48_16]OGE96778.1 MAG: hypothetical protein A2990_00500 [Candidatus Doudnabacteria bacterium RIFCSPLOWO2_01_FULL_49_40]OGF02855.1 MAG: hypothetical protein A3H14_00130 [Candid